MVLTPLDLQQIGQLLEKTIDKKLEKTFDEKLGLKPGQTLDQKFDEKLGLKPGQTLDQKFNEKLAPLEKIVLSHQKILNNHTKMLKRLKRDQDVILGYLDHEQVDIKRRLSVIEERLSIN